MRRPHAGVRRGRRDEVALSLRAGVAEAAKLHLVLVEEHREDGLVGDDEERQLLDGRLFEALEVRDSLGHAELVEEAQLPVEERGKAQRLEHRQEPEAERLARRAEECVDVFDEDVETLDRDFSGGGEERFRDRANDRAMARPERRSSVIGGHELRQRHGAGSIEVAVASRRLWYDGAVAVATRCKLGRGAALVVSMLTICAAPLSCDRRPTPGPAPAPAASKTQPVEGQEAEDTGTLGRPQPAPERVVAIGDLHGDLEAARRVLGLAGAIDANGGWIGKNLVVVQTGDQIDRGDDDRKILDFFEKLAGEAKEKGGEIRSLLGNHEVMNAMFDFRYVTAGGLSAFTDIRANVPRVEGLEAVQRGRAAAFAPGTGPYAAMLAKRPVMTRVGDSLFVHGGILPKHVRYGLDRINASTRAWLEGKETQPLPILVAEDGPIWTRMYSAAPSREDCQKLDEVLRLLHAKRLVMGHTVQKPKISAACDDRAWRIDVGLAKVYGGPVQALEIRGDVVTVLASP